MIRIVASFVAGIVLVVGSALIYSKTQDLRRAREAQQALSAAQQTVSSSNQLTEATPTVENDVPPQNDPDRTKSNLPKRSRKGAPVEIFPPVRAPENAPTVRNDLSAHTQAHLPSDAGPVAGYSAPAEQPAHSNAATAPARTPQASVLRLEPGTNLVVRLAEEVSTAHNDDGDLFRGTVEVPISVNGVVIADRGATAFGRVVKAHRAPLIGGKSELILTLTELDATDGQPIRVQTNNWEQTGAHSNLKNATKVAFGSAVGAVVGAVAGAARGAGISSAVEPSETRSGASARRAVTLPRGTLLGFQLAQPLVVAGRFGEQ